MINTHIGTDLQGIQSWQQLASILNADKADNVKNATVELGNNVIQVTVNDGASTHTVTISAPDLGKVEGAPDTEALAKMAEDIKSLVTLLSSVDESASQELSQAIANLQTDLATAVKDNPSTVGGSLKTVNTSKALFDLYALMALMVQVAQTQRDKAREIRQTENQQIQNSIQQQADEIRDAALIALWFGACTAAVSGAMSIVSMIGQAYSFRQQTNATRQMDLPAKNLEAAKLATNPEAALEKFESAAKPGTASGTKMMDYLCKTFHKGENQTPEAFAAFEKDFTDQLGVARKQVSDAQAAEKTAGEELVKAQGDSKTTDTELASKKKTYEDAVKATQDAKNGYSAIEQELFGKLEMRQRANEVEITQLKEKLSTADSSEAKNIEAKLAAKNAQHEYLRLYTAKMKSQYASTEMKNADLVAAQRRYDDAKSSLNIDTKFTNSQQLMNRWMGINQVAMTLTQFTGSLGNLLAERERATATEEGVKQTQHNEQLDQIKDLFSQAETVVQAVVQLMQAVLSAENESVMKAIRA